MVTLWIDSISHLRRFIFLPGGDVGLGFRSTHGSLQWVEYAPWEPSGLIDVVRWSVPYWVLNIIIGGSFCLYILREKRMTKPSVGGKTGKLGTGKPFSVKNWGF